jgi:hypothetical protein
MLNTTVFIALLLSCYLSLASAIPFQRRAGGIITQCTVPNTVALTFVRPSMFATSPLGASPEADLIFSPLIFQDDGPYTYLYDIFFMTSQTPCTDPVF